MAYQTGIYIDESDLRSAFSIFASNNSWTLNKNDASHVALQKGSFFFNIGPTLIVQGSTGFDTLSVWNEQAGNPSSEIWGTLFSTETNPPKTNGVYHFFAIGDTLAIMAEGQNQYAHMIFGATNIGVPAWNCSHGGGAGRYGVGPADEDIVPSCFIRSVYIPGWGSSFTMARASAYVDNEWIDGTKTNGSIVQPIGDILGGNSIYGSYDHNFITPLIDTSNNSFKGNSVLVRPYMFKSYNADYNDDSSENAYIGYFEGIRLLDAYDYTDGDEINYQTEIYIQTKICKISEIDDRYGKNRYAIAIRKN